MRTYPGLPDLYSGLPELDMKFGSVNLRIRNQDLEFIDIVVASLIEGRSLQFNQKIFRFFLDALRSCFSRLLFFFNVLSFLLFVIAGIKSGLY